MGILRTDVVSHSQLEGSGSVELDGVGDYLTFGSHSAFSPATADIFLTNVYISSAFPFSKIF